jgi:hypothetical protein
MLAAVLVLGADSTGPVLEPKTTGDYVFLYGGLAIVGAAILILAIRSWRRRRAK